MPRVRRKANIGRRTRKVQRAYDLRLNRTVKEHSTDNAISRSQVASSRANENSNQRNQRLRADALSQREKHERTTNADRERNRRRMQEKRRLTLASLNRLAFEYNPQVDYSSHISIESQPNTEVLELYINQGKDSNQDTVSTEKLEQSPEECQPYVPFGEVYIKQEVDPDLSIVPKVELEELPEEWQPNEPFEEIYIKQEPEENGESLVGGEQLNGFNKEPEEDVEVQVKDEPLNGFKTEISEDLGIVTEDDLPEECQPEIQFETVYVD